MNFLKLLKIIVGIKKPTTIVVKKSISKGPLKDAPLVQRDELDFIAGAMGRGKWEDVEYEGPGAAEAEARRARRARSLGIKDNKEKKAGQKKK